MTTEPCQIVLCTCPDRDTARQIAAALVEEKLAACVNILDGVESVYRWQGKVESAQETLLVIKTTQTAFTMLRDRIVSLHPYELPEVVAVPIVDGLDAYLNWISQAE